MLHHHSKKFRVRTRRYLRLPAPWPVKIEPGAAPGDLHVTTTRNVSSGGTAVVVQKKVPVGTPLSVEIYVPWLDRTVRAAGQVVRCLPVRGNRFELGIHFVKIGSEDRAILIKAVEKPAKRWR